MVIFWRDPRFYTGSPHMVMGTAISMGSSEPFSHAQIQYFGDSTRSHQKKYAAEHPYHQEFRRPPSGASGREIGGKGGRGAQRLIENFDFCAGAPTSPLIENLHHDKVSISAIPISERGPRFDIIILSIDLCDGFRKRALRCGWRRFSQ